MGHLTVAQNVFIGREPRRGLLLDEKALNRKTAELFEDLHIPLDPRGASPALPWPSSRWSRSRRRCRTTRTS